MRKAEQKHHSQNKQLITLEEVFQQGGLRDGQTIQIRIPSDVIKKTIINMSEVNGCPRQHFARIRKKQNQ